MKALSASLKEVADDMDRRAGVTRASVPKVEIEKVSHPHLTEAVLKCVCGHETDLMKEMCEGEIIDIDDEFECSECGREYRVTGLTPFEVDYFNSEAEEYFNREEPDFYYDEQHEMEKD